MANAGNDGSVRQKILLEKIGRMPTMEMDTDEVGLFVDKQRVKASFARRQISIEYPLHDETPDTPILDTFYDLNIGKSGEKVLISTTNKNIYPEKSTLIQTKNFNNLKENESRCDKPFIVKDLSEEEEDEGYTRSCCCFKIRKGHKKQKWPPKFGYRDLFLGFISFLTFGFDYGTDIRLMIEYLLDGEFALFALSCGFIAVPSFVSGLISVLWYKMTYSRDKHLDFKHAKALYYARICASFFQLGRLFRQSEYIYCVVHSIRLQKLDDGNSRRSLSYRKRAMVEKRDAAMLGLIDGFMESALQLILQLYLTIYLQLPGTFPRVSSLVSSWMSTALIVTTYYRSNRKALKYTLNVDYFSSIVYFLWKFTELGPRYLLVAITGAFFQPWCFIFVPIHICFVFILHMAFNPELEGICTSTPPDDNPNEDEHALKPDTETDPTTAFCILKFSKCLQYLFVLSMSFVGIFTYINLKDGRTWPITLIYYCVFYLENIFMAVIYLYVSVTTDNVTDWTYALFALPVGILFHTVFSGLYYGYFHPRKWNDKAPSIKFQCCC